MQAPRARQQDVLGLDVAVNDSLRVSRGQAVRHIARDSHRLRHGERAPRDPIAQRFALVIRHGDEEPVIRAAPDLVNGDNVRVVEPGRRPSLVGEPADPGRVMAQVG